MRTRIQQKTVDYAKERAEEAYARHEVTVIRPGHFQFKNPNQGMYSCYIDEVNNGLLIGGDGPDAHIKTGLHHLRDVLLKPGYGPDYMFGKLGLGKKEFFEFNPDLIPRKGWFADRPNGRRSHRDIIISDYASEDLYYGYLRDNGFQEGDFEYWPHPVSIHFSFFFLMFGLKQFFERAPVSENRNVIGSLKHAREG